MRQARQTNTVIRFRQRPRRPVWLPYGPMAIVTIILSLAAVNALSRDQVATDATAPAPVASEPSAPLSRTFTLCEHGAHTNCVIDGDTFRLDGQKVRISGIDAPEIHPSHCAREEQLGQAAKRRLLDLLNAGAFELRASDRDHDRYGRDLREVYRGGTSLGDRLVTEGLARPWDGHHHSWCD